MKVDRQNHADSETGDPKFDGSAAFSRCRRQSVIEGRLRAKSYPPTIERSRGRGQRNDSGYGANFITVSMRRGANLI